MTVQLATLPDARESIVVVGTAVRKPLAVLQAYLASLAWQEWPARVKPHFIFVPDWPQRDTDAEQALRAWTAECGGELLRAGPSAVGDFDDTHPQTHQWSLGAMQRVAAAKNRILKRALELRADAVWLADADLVMDRTTFASLWSVERPIACAVYWTHWHRQGHETRVLHAAPQVWLRHPYQLDGRGMDEAEFRAKLVRRELTRVWGQGACSLIRMPVLQAGISFEHLPEPALMQGLMAGEDRHFCLRAERSHIEMWADAWPDIFHVYHLATDVARIAEMQTRVGAMHPERATLGDLVALRLQAEEPLPTPQGWQPVPPQFARGRLGALPLLPELEEAIHGLRRGGSEIVPVHVPFHYPNGFLRGRRRLIRVTLVDCKPNGWPPVLEDEIIVARASGRVIDSTTLSDEQLAGMKEIATA